MATLKQLELLKDEIKSKLEPVGDYHAAVTVITVMANKAKNQYNIAEKDIAELFEDSFGACAQIDEALDTMYPSTYANR